MEIDIILWSIDEMTMLLMSLVKLLNFPFAVYGGIVRGTTGLKLEVRTYMQI
jgi:hypothetical protein